MVTIFLNYRKMLIALWLVLIPGAMPNSNFCDEPHRLIPYLNP